MIRPARMADIFRLVELLEYAQARSTYAGVVEVDAAYSRKALGQLIMKHGGVFHGGSFCMVVEDSDATIQAFMAATLDRVHSFGDMLQAIDVALVATITAPKGAIVALFNAYVDWASANPRVYQILATRTDALPGSDRLDGIFKRSGFRLSGAVFQRQNVQALTSEEPEPKAELVL